MPTAADLDAQAERIVQQMYQILVKARRGKRYCAFVQQFAILVSAFWTVYGLLNLVRFDLWMAVAGFCAALVAWRVGQFFQRQVVAYAEFIAVAVVELEQVAKMLKVVFKPRG